jgi:hypothetical protein
MITLIVLFLSWKLYPETIHWDCPYDEDCNGITDCIACYCNYGVVLIMYCIYDEMYYLCNRKSKKVHVDVKFSIYYI